MLKLGSGRYNDINCGSDIASLLHCTLYVGEGTELDVGLGKETPSTV